MFTLPANTNEAQRLHQCNNKSSIWTCWTCRKLWISALKWYFIDRLSAKRLCLLVSVGRHSAASAKEQNPAACGAHSCLHRAWKMDLLVKESSLCSLFHPAVHLLGVSVSPSLALGVPLVKWVGAPGIYSEMQCINSAETNARMSRARSASHIKEHRVSGSTLGWSPSWWRRWCRDESQLQSQRVVKQKYTRDGRLQIGHKM